MSKQRILNLAPNLKIPAEDAVESVFGLIGKRKRGKTGFARVLLEEIHGAGLPFVAFDPVGVLWGLRSSADGRGKGLPILVVGGAYGDLPIDRRAGADVAKGIVEQNVSAVIDFSAESKACYRQFIGDFCDTLYRINKSSRHVLIEEAPEVLPQRLRPDLARTFEAVERLFSRGRNRGLGGTVISQRAATLNKDVMSQADHIVAFGVTAPQDRKAIGEWVEGKTEPEMLKRFLAGLASLKEREGWFWSPEMLDLFVKFRTRTMRTFHPDRTHLRRMGLTRVEPVRTDVSGLVSSLTTLIEKLGIDQGDKRKAPKPPRTIAVADGRTTAVLQKLTAELEAIRVERDGLRTHVRALQGAVAEGEKRRVATIKLARSLESPLRTALDKVSALLGALEQGVELPAPPASAPRVRSQPRAAPAAPVEAGAKPPTPALPSAANGVSGPHRRILAAMHHNPQDRVELAVRAGYNPNGGAFNNYLSEMRTRGYIEGRGTSLQLTPAGRAIPVEELPDPLDFWLSKLGKAERMIIEALRRGPLSREQVAEDTGYEGRGGSFNNAMSKVRRLGLMIGKGSEMRRLPDWLA